MTVFLEINDKAKTKKRLNLEDLSEDNLKIILFLTSERN